MLDNIADIIDVIDDNYTVDNIILATLTSLIDIVDNIIDDIDNVDYVNNLMLQDWLHWQCW